jgi:hypothetical protein
MIESKTEPECSERPLPLFRPEALASQQQKFYGEILLIRPFSLALLVWLGIGIASSVLAFLLLGHYTETVHVAGVSLPAQSTTSSEAALYVPERAVKFVNPGEVVVLRSPADPQAVPQKATVEKISESPLSPEAIASQTGVTVPEPMYQVSVAVPASEMQSGTRVEAELPAGRKPLLSWLFETDKSSRSSGNSQANKK